MNPEDVQESVRSDSGAALSRARAGARRSEGKGREGIREGISNSPSTPTQRFVTRDGGTVDGPPPPGQPETPCGCGHPDEASSGRDCGPAQTAEVDALMRAEVDLVNSPPHYTSHPSGVECITVAEHFGFNLGNALKYIWRADEKGAALVDLEKARWYLDREITRRAAVQR